MIKGKPPIMTWRDGHDFFLVMIMIIVLMMKSARNVMIMIILLMMMSARNVMIMIVVV